MIRTLSKLAFLLLIAVPAKAQLWNGILDSTHAIDWRNQPAFTFVIPDATLTQCGSTIAAYTGTAATINTAIANCGSGHFVSLASGTFSLSTAIVWNGHSGVEVRGAGPLVTLIKFTGNSGGYSGTTTIGMWDATNVGGIFDGRNPAVQPGGSNALTLTGTVEGGVGVYPQGATHITVSGVGSDTPQVGTLLLLDQANDTTPANGWLVCDTTSSNGCSANGGADGRTVAAVQYSQVQAVKITACTPNCGAATGYTINPGLYGNNIRASQTPGAWWSTSSGLCDQCGLENLTLDQQNAGSPLSGINMLNCYHCWIKNVREILGGTRNHIYVIQSAASIIRDSYWFSSVGRGNGSGYMLDPLESSDFLVENNICDETPACIVAEDMSGLIFSYNFGYNPIPQPAAMNPTYPSHDPGSEMSLYEGNFFNGFSMDTQHGGSTTFTFFRDQLEGQQYIPNDTPVNTSVFNESSYEIQAYQHGESIIGNVLGIMTCAGGANAGRPADLNSQCPGSTVGTTPWQTAFAGVNGGICTPSIFVLGFVSACLTTSTNGNGTINQDPNVVQTLMRWGNYDVVHAATQFNAGDVPTTAYPFLAALTVPATHNLPASFYYSSKPSWWNGVGFTAPPFPPIGPDVTGGDLQGFNGHAYRIPARLCFEQTAQDATNYPGTKIAAFDANTCYTTAVPPAPATTMFTISGPGTISGQGAIQ